jgi:hypothetical protein
MFDTSADVARAALRLLDLAKVNSESCLELELAATILSTHVSCVAPARTD